VLYNRFRSITMRRADDETADTSFGNSAPECRLELPGSRRVQSQTWLRRGVLLTDSWVFAVKVHVFVTRTLTAI
jgi:hypothetical protein